MTAAFRTCLETLEQIQSFAEMIIETQTTMADAHKALIQQIIDAAKAQLSHDEQEPAE